MISIDITDLKGTREALCAAQAALNTMQASNRWSHVERLSKVIAEIDKLRPLGPDGKHGNRHTRDCGCEDKRNHRHTVSHAHGPSNVFRCDLCGRKVSLSHDGKDWLLLG